MAPVTSITITRAMNENRQFTKAKHTRSSGKMYFGIYTFLMSGAALSMLPMALPVPSLKKLNSSCPMIKYTEKFSIPLPRMSKSVENTTTMTTFISSGLSTLHTTPSTLRRYFSLKSRPIRFCSR